jgi:hypothetical protein
MKKKRLGEVLRERGHVADRLPDVCPRGMFINTSQRFPEGAVLNLSFRLALSGAEIQTRCEVRYRQPGVGVGVEFIGISPDATRQIETEIELCKRHKKNTTTTSSGQRLKKRSRY